MKPIVQFMLIVILFIVYSCGSTASVEDKSAPNDTFHLLNEKGINGVITTKYATQGCQFIFEYEEGDGAKKIVRPINLDQEFQRDMHVRMVFRISRVSNAGCDLAHPVIVEAIEEILPR